MDIAAIRPRLVADEMQIDHLKRRDFISLLGGAIVGCPLSTRAQQSAKPVLGFLNSGSPGPFMRNVAALRQGLREGGYIEGQNVAIEFRWAESQTDQLPALAADLVRRQVAMIVAFDSASALAAKIEASRTIPVIFLIGGDPLRLGLVASFNRPGGNITGVTILFNNLVAKQVETVHAAVPQADLIGFLVNPRNPNAESDARAAQAAANLLGQKLVVAKGSTESDLETVFGALAEQRAAALVVSADPLFISKLEKLVELAARQTLPAIYPMREFVAAGGLMSCGTSLADGYREVGLYAGRILKGADPADLPILQATKVELVINLKTAKMLGLAIPFAVLGRADEVIE